MPITTYAFLLSLIDLKQWKITWIHLSSLSFPKYVQFHENYKESGKIDGREQLKGLLDFQYEGKHIVVIDGYNDFVDHNEISYQTL
jgi:D-mannonate dehydratase